MINTATPIFSRSLLTSLVLAALASSPALAAPLWQDAAAPAAQERSDRAVRATKSRWVEVDVDAVSATMRRMTAAKAAKAAAPAAAWVCSPSDQHPPIKRISNAIFSHR